MTKPYVYLIGAGPGDEELITVKGLACIQKADVILYDYLSSPELLAYQKEGAVSINVGKSAGRHEYAQDEINQLLIEKAQEGKLVARLKGGDPYVFGRGGEEAMALVKAGVPFEVIPGITSAIGALNYGGIPVTHRNVSTSFHVITGHENPDKPKGTVNYQALAQLEGTLIFLMGVGHLQQIVSRLIQHGKSADTPAALVHRGTTARQRVVTGTLETIVSVVQAAKMGPPAIIVVGEVVSLRDQLNWFETKPLHGKRIMVTRTRQQASSLSKALREQGAQVVEFPTIQIAPAPREAVKESFRTIQQADYLLFTSVNGVKYFFQMMKDLHLDIRSLQNCRLAAVGKITAEALEEYGVFPALVAQDYSGEGLVESLKEILKPGDRVVIPKAAVSRPILQEELTRLGAQVEEIHLYTTEIPTSSQNQLIEHLKAGIDIITFASSSTVTNFIEILGKENLSLLDQIKIGAIGPITANTIKQSGLRVDFQGKENTILSLAEQIIEEA